MFRMQMWQYVVVGIVALACVGAMSWTVSGIFARRAASPATLREATAFESAAASAEAPAGALALDGFSYRVPARLAGRLRVVVLEGTVSLAGPRVASGPYQSWIWAQALVLALVPVALVTAAVKLDWRWLAVAVGVLAVQLAFSSLLAAAWPGIGELDWLSAGRFRAVEFPVAAVSDVKIGVGWADGGIDVVLLPVKAGIDAMSKDHAVSFFAPDEDGREVRYAVHFPRSEDATALAEALR